MCEKKKYLEKIIKNTNEVLSNINCGSQISQAEFNMLGYVSGIMSRMSESTRPEGGVFISKDRALVSNLKSDIEFANRLGMKKLKD